MDGDPDDPQSWNRYAYVLNNPMRYTDSTGVATTSFECDDSGCQMTVTPDPEPAGPSQGFQQWMAQARAEWEEFRNKPREPYTLGSRIFRDTFNAQGFANTWNRFIDYIAPDSEGELAMAVVPEMKLANMLDKTAEELIRGSLKASESYRSELARKTCREIIAMSRKDEPGQRNGSADQCRIGSGC